MVGLRVKQLEVELPRLGQLELPGQRLGQQQQRLRALRLGQVRACQAQRGQRVLGPLVARLDLAQPQPSQAERGFQRHGHGVGGLGGGQVGQGAVRLAQLQLQQRRALGLAQGVFHQAQRALGVTGGTQGARAGQGRRVGAFGVHEVRGVRGG